MFAPCLRLLNQDIAFVLPHTVEGIHVAPLEQYGFMTKITNHMQHRRLPYRAMWQETQNRDLPALPSSLCCITARCHSYEMTSPMRVLSYGLGNMGRSHSLQPLVQEDCHLSSGFSLELPNDFQQRFPMGFQFCEIWCVKGNRWTHRWLTWGLTIMSAFSGSRVPATWTHGWSKHGSSTKPSTTEWILLESCLHQQGLHVAGSGSRVAYMYIQILQIYVNIYIYIYILHIIHQILAPTRRGQVCLCACSAPGNPTCIYIYIYIYTPSHSMSSERVFILQTLV